MTKGDLDALKAKAKTFIAQNPDLKFVDVFLADLNGVLRGKRLPADQAMKVFDGGLRMPRSLVGLDIWGEDVFANGLVLEEGDSDGLCIPSEFGLLPTLWTRQKTAQVQFMMAEQDGASFLADPRQLLIHVQQKLHAKGMRPVAAFELEFHLFPLPEDGGFFQIGSLSQGQFGHLCDLDRLEDLSAFFDDLYANCDAQGVALGAAAKEAGPFQFELNLHHKPDAVLASDELILLRRAVKGVARKHGLLASFMAKPFGDLPGNGMHAHVSMLDQHGENLFALPGERGRPDPLMQAVAGLLKAANESMILFAPHFNSARRFKAESHAPIRASWGTDNRIAAIRIPSDGGKNRRFEHRIAGVDANPYLVMACLLAGAAYGMENELSPGPALSGDSFSDTDPVLDADWHRSLASYEKGEVLAPEFGPLFSQVFGACKRQEFATFASKVTDFEYATYLRAF